MKNYKNGNNYLNIQKFLVLVSRFSEKNYHLAVVIPKI